MTVDLNFEINDLTGKPIGTAGEAVAGLLMTESKGDAVKYFDWAITLNKKETIEVDASDLNKLRTLLNDTDRMMTLVKGPIIKYLDTLK
jgi:hypothetical protein